MANASDTGNPARPLAPRLRVGDGIPVFSLPNTSGVSVSSTVLLETGPLIITFYRGIWCPYCRSDLMALTNATFEVQSRGGSLAADCPEFWARPDKASPRLTTAASATRGTDGLQTLRWRGMDSNFQYAGAVNLFVAPFVVPGYLGPVGAS
jgi:hypothetical protein